MTLQSVLNLQQDLFKQSEKIMANKNAAYAGGSSDGLANFYRLASVCHSEPSDVICILMEKHLDVIRQCSFDSSEELRERICDTINYLTLYYALHSEM